MKYLICATCVAILSFVGYSAFQEFKPVKVNERARCLALLRNHADSDLISRCVYAGHITPKDVGL